jgi:ParB/RepB/Spo0J family partition protein
MAVAWIDPAVLKNDPNNEHGEITPESDADLAGLVESIRQVGILEPLRVYRKHGHTYINSGHRRAAAALLAGLGSVPCVVVEAPGQLQGEIQRLVSNIQRKDINPVALAVTCKRLREAHPELTQATLASKLGMSQPALANLLRLLRLPDKVLDYIADGRLSAGHGMALLRVEEPPIDDFGKETPIADWQADQAAQWVGKESSVRVAETDIQGIQSVQKWYRQHQEDAKKYAQQNAEMEAARAGIPVEELEAKRKDEKRAGMAEGKARTKRVKVVQAALVEAVRVYGDQDVIAGVSMPLADMEHVRMMALALNKGYIMADVRRAWGLPMHDEMDALILACEYENDLMVYCARLAMPQVLEVEYDGKSVGTTSRVYSDRVEILRRAEEAWGVQNAATVALAALDEDTLASRAEKGNL